MTGSLRLGLFFSNSWKSRVAVGWFACLRQEAAACWKPGIVRLTSDIGLRPNARCPARGACVTVEAAAAGEHPKETVGRGEGTNRRFQLHHACCPERTADAGVGTGEFPVLKKVFLKTLAPHWVDGSFVGCYGYRASNVKEKTVSTLALLSKLRSTLSLRFIDTAQGGHTLSGL